MVVKMRRQMQFNITDDGFPLAIFVYINLMPPRGLAMLRQLLFAKQYQLPTHPHVIVVSMTYSMLPKSNDPSAQLTLRSQNTICRSQEAADT